MSLLYVSFRLQPKIIKLRTQQDNEQGFFPPLFFASCRIWFGEAIAMLLICCLFQLFVQYKHAEQYRRLFFWGWRWNNAKQWMHSTALYHQKNTKQQWRKNSFCSCCLFLQWTGLAGMMRAVTLVLFTLCRFCRRPQNKAQRKDSRFHSEVERRTEDESYLTFKKQMCPGFVQLKRELSEIALHFTCFMTTVKPACSADGVYNLFRLVSPDWLQSFPEAEKPTSVGSLGSWSWAEDECVCVCVFAFKWWPLKAASVCTVAIYINIKKTSWLWEKMLLWRVSSHTSEESRDLSVVLFSSYSGHQKWGVSRHRRCCQGECIRCRLYSGL